MTRLEGELVSTILFLNRDRLLILEPSRAGFWFPIRSVVEIHLEIEWFGVGNDKLIGKGIELGEGVAFGLFPWSDPAGQSIVSSLGNRDQCGGDEQKGHARDGCPAPVTWVGSGSAEIFFFHALVGLFESGFDESFTPRRMPSQLHDSE